MSSSLVLPDTRTLISIVGPTATGKTRRALHLAEQAVKSGQYAGAVIISADSRQVYRGLEVVSGADVPAEFVVDSYSAGRYGQTEWADFFEGRSFFKSETIEFHGVSLLDFDEDWSLAHFQRFALAIIYDAWQRNWLPIVVGGTGLYHTRLFAEELQDKAGPDQDLRAELELASLSELQTKLTALNADAFNQLSPADQKNRRRIIRALERLQLTQTNNSPRYQVVTPTNHQIIKPSLELEEIETAIAERVRQRLTDGAIEEVQKLLSWWQKFEEKRTKPAIFTATGVKEILLYLEEKIDYDQLVELWTRRERQYAKRQLTWWKKH